MAAHTGQPFIKRVCLTMILHINACIRPQSRTRLLADEVLDCLGDEVKEVKLSEAGIVPLLWNDLCKRDEAIAKGDFSSHYFDQVKDFISADELVVSAPYWDMSFPSVLKVYLEAMMVLGLSFTYNEDGLPVGLCKAKRLIYVTTAGGTIGKYNMGYDYVRALAGKYFGIPDTHCFMAENLDIAGEDTGGILKDALKEIKEYFKAE